MHQDPELISIAGSVHSRSASPVPRVRKDAIDGTPGEEQPGFLKGIGNMIFGKSEDETSVRSPQFPWKKYLIEGDVMRRWKTVDMRQVQHLHANFDIDQAQFVNCDLEEVSMRPSQQVPIM